MYSIQSPNPPSPSHTLTPYTPPSLTHTQYLGIPTHDTKGELLSKGLVKKLTKEHTKQKEAYDKYIAINTSNTTI